MNILFWILNIITGIAATLKLMGIINLPWVVVISPLLVLLTVFVVYAIFVLWRCLQVVSKLASLFKEIVENEKNLK